MKFLFENWKKFLEGKVIQGPWEDSPDEPTIQFVNSLEDQIQNKLVEKYGEMSRVPQEQLELLDTIMTYTDILFKLKK
jgi:hypothetical protein